MQSIIFTFYFLLFSWLITIIPFFTRSGIGKWWLIILFIIKIAAGFAYAKYFSLPQYIATADTWKYYNNSLTETDWLLRDPVAFIKDLFYSPYQQSGNLFSGSSSYWNDLKDNSIIKFMAVMNVFTGKSYYTNIIVFNFLYLFGPVALFRIAKPFWNNNKLWLILIIFLLPSFLFWCSGIHKDGLIFSAMMISIYCFWQQVNEHRFIWKYSLIILFCFLVLFALRNIILLLLLPALLALFFSEKKPRYQWLIFSGLYVSGLILFFVLPHITAALNFPQYIINKQNEFNALTGNSKITLPTLEPTAASFTKFFPYAIDLIFFRPHISDIAGINYLLTFLENGFIILVLLAWILWHQPVKNIPSILVCLLFFSLSVWLLCGYTVTFSGAIARYKSMVTSLFFTFLLLTLDYRKISFIKREK